MKKPREVINQLSPQDALVVLKALDEMDAFIQKQLPKWQRLQRLLKGPRTARC